MRKCVRGQSVLPYALRPMEEGDLDQVAAMERESFPTLWPPTSYRRELKNRMAEYSVCVRDDEFVTEQPKPGKKGLLGFLGRRNKPQEPVQRQLLVGFVGLWYMAGEAHIVSIAVRETYRRKGLGELLLIGSVEMALRRECQVVTLEARVSNDAAIALYDKYGFNEVGLRRRYYSDNGEDAVIMTTDKLTSPEYDTLFEQRVDAFDERYGETVREYLT
jgi:[ribosomal protein S18]-alanine N-acetyltransferase